MPILYLVKRDSHENDEANMVHEWHEWLLNKADALKYAKRESGNWGVAADVYRVNIPNTKPGIFIALRLGFSPELLEKQLGHDKVQRVAQFHSGTRLDRKPKTSFLERAVEQARALLREEGGA
tara:strand:- start:608 stop:976 length:369 start_codon:yes stop_codon:yes gene_type:complete